MKVIWADNIIASLENVKYVEKCGNKSRGYHIFIQYMNGETLSFSDTKDHELLDKRFQKIFEILSLD